MLLEVLDALGVGREPYSEKRGMVEMTPTLSYKQSERKTPVKCLCEDDLITLARAGSEQAFTELVSRHGERTRRIVSRIIRNREDAEDILQETYMKLFLHLASFNGKSQFSTWLSRIAINSALMLLRKRRSHPEHSMDSFDSDQSAMIMDIPDYSESAEAHLLHSERRHKLRSAVQRLPHPLRHIVELRNCDLPLVEIAQRTGLSVAALKARLYRARMTLRKLTAHGVYKDRRIVGGGSMLEVDHDGV